MVAQRQAMKHACEVCEEAFACYDALAAHSLLHDPADRIVCRACDYESITLQGHRQHMQHCFTCSDCLRHFSSENRRDEHVCLVTNGQPLVCACGQTFVHYDNLVEHAGGSRPFNCCACERTSSSLTSHIRHLRQHSQQRPFLCPGCGQAFPASHQLRRHITKCHDGAEAIAETSRRTSADLVQCPDCPRRVRLERLEVHRKKHTPSSCLCPDCGKLFDSNKRLTKHIITTHQSEPVTCNSCLKVLKTKKILAEHLKTHLKTETGTRVAQAICPMCGLELAQKGSLARHILLVHERHKLKQDDSPRTCRECGIVLPNSAQYYSHRRQHRAAQESFPCLVCAREFNKKQNLLRHMHLLHDQNRVLDNPTFVCDLCSRQFRERRNLVRHCRLVHKIEVTFS